MPVGLPTHRGRELVRYPEGPTAAGCLVVVIAAVRGLQLGGCAIGVRVGVRAGRLLGVTGAGSEKAIDAFIVAVADLQGGAVVATVDKTDLETMAAHPSNVLVEDNSA